MYIKHRKKVTGSFEDPKMNESDDGEYLLRKKPMFWIHDLNWLKLVEITK